MSKKTNNTKAAIATKSGATQHVKVMYQNLGGTWYAFANVNDEIFFSPIQLKQLAPSTQTKKKLIEKDAAA